VRIGIVSMSDSRKNYRPFSNMPGKTPLPGRTSATPPPVAPAEVGDPRTRELTAKLEAALARVATLEATLAETRRDQERARQDAQRAVENAAAAELRAARAEQSLVEGVAALERTRTEREVDRARLIEVGAEVEMTKREAAQAVEAAEAVAAEAQRIAADLQVKLSRAEDVATKGTDMLSEMERQEAVATTDRLRSIQRAKRILSGQPDSKNR
jgi:chromosome segregation ATPase